MNESRIINRDSAELVARRFQALADPTRLRILGQLSLRKEASVGELTEAVKASQQNVSKHLAALFAEGFVDRRKQGTSTIYWISDATVLDLCEQVSDGLQAQLAKLGAVLGS